MVPENDSGYYHRPDDASTTFDEYNNEVYFALLRVNSVIAVVSTVAACYIILRHSPPEIGSYKWYLLNITLCSFVFDVYMTVFYTPLTLFPALVICSRGILSPLGWFYGGVVPFYLSLMFFGGVAMSVTMAFTYRLYIVRNKRKLVTSAAWFIGFGLLHVFYELPTMVLYAFSILDREVVSEAIITRYPNIAPWFVDQSCTATAFETSTAANLFMATFVLQFFLHAPIDGILIWKCFTELRARRKAMTERTFALHRQLIIALTLQLVIPAFTLFLPFSLFALFAYLELRGVAWIYQTLLVVGTLHSFFNTLLMVVSVKPYRVKVLQALITESRPPTDCPQLDQLQGSDKLLAGSTTATPSVQGL